MTAISLNFRAAALAAETGRVPICLITFSHESLLTPIRVSSDPTSRIIETDTELIYGTVSRGETYVFVPARIKLPDDTSEGPGTMTLEMDNVGRELTETIRTIFTPISTTVEFVMDNALDTVDLRWPEYVLTNIAYDASTVTGTLVLETLVREPFPGLYFTPSTTPGLFL